MEEVISGEHKVSFKEATSNRKEKKVFGEAGRPFLRSPSHSKPSKTTLALSKRNAKGSKKRQGLGELSS